MKRRQVLKGIAAGSATSIGIAGAASDPNARRVDIDRLDRVLVTDGDRVVRTAENPTWDDVKRLKSETDDGQTVVTPQNECVEFCRSNCSCSPCAYGCSNCCNVSQDICNCCDCSQDGCEDHSNCT